MSKDNIIGKEFVKCKTDSELHLLFGRNNLTLMSKNDGDFIKGADVGSIKYLIENNADVNAVNPRGITPLSLVSRVPELHSLDFFKILIENKADFNKKSSTKFDEDHKWKIKATPFYEFCYRADFQTSEEPMEIVKFLVENNADLNLGFTNENNEISAFQLLYHKSFIKDKDLLFYHSLLIRDEGYYNDTYEYRLEAPLQNKLSVLSVEDIKFFIEHNAEINKTTFVKKVIDKVWKPSEGSFDEGFIKYLIENKADVNGSGFLNSSVRWDYVNTLDFMKLLIEHKANFSAGNMISICQKKSMDIEVIKLLLDHGSGDIDINATDYNSNNFHNILKNVKFALNDLVFFANKKADFNFISKQVSNKNSSTYIFGTQYDQINSLDCFNQNKHNFQDKSLIIRFIESKGDLNLLSIQKNLEPIEIRSLIDKKANINAKNEEGQSYLMMLHEAKDLTIQDIQLLFDAKADVNIKNKNSVPLLETLCDDKKLTLNDFQLLIKMNGDVKAMHTKDGEHTIFQHTMDVLQDEMIQFLGDNL